MVGTASQLEKVEPADDVGNNCRKQLEDNNLDFMRWRRSSYESISIYSGMKDYDIVETTSAWG